MTTPSTKPLVSKPSPADVATAAALTTRKRAPTTAHGLAKLLWPGQLYLASAICAVLDALSVLGLAPSWFKPQARTRSAGLASTGTGQNRPGKVPPAHESTGEALPSPDAGKVAKTTTPVEAPQRDRAAIGDVVSRDASGEARPCAYCRSPAQCVDRFGPGHALHEVASCLDCRKHARRSGHASMTKRRAAVKRGIASDAEAYLAMPNWTTTEIGNLGPCMRAAVKLALRRKATAKRRLG